MVVRGVMGKHRIRLLDSKIVENCMVCMEWGFGRIRSIKLRKNINMQITTILAFITAMGGLEAVKWLVRYITCRKTDARKEEASVNSMEEENRRKKVDWLEERLTHRDEKIDGLYIELRKEQEEKIDWIHKCHEVEWIQKESEVKKCEIRGCVKRMPPSDY